MSLQIIPIQDGASFILPANNYLKVTSIKGSQVSDLVAFNAHDITEYISNGKTFDFEETIYLTEGNNLWSNESNILLEIVKDTCGVHDFLLAPCSKKTFEILYNDFSDHPSCFSNLFKSLKDYNIQPENIPTAFNIFMNVKVDLKGKITLDTPTVTSEDYIIFKSNMDLIIGMTSCSAEKTNNYKFSEIGYEISPDLSTLT